MLSPIETASVRRTTGKAMATLPRLDREKGQQTAVQEYVHMQGTLLHVSTSTSSWAQGRPL